MQKILIIQTAFLGDVILATPVLSELKRIFPSSTVDFLVRKGNEGLLSNNPNCNTIFLFDKKNGKYKNIWNLIKNVRKEKYDLVINLHRFGSSGIITAFSGSKLKYGFKKNPFSFSYTKKFDHSLENGKHEVERNLSLITEFGAISKKRPELYPSKEHFNNVEEYKIKDYFCMAPASVWFTKQLPKEKWIELVKYYSSKGIVYLLGGKEDIQLCEEILSKSDVNDNCRNLAGKLNLLESAALIKDAKRTFVNDSGPLHLSSSMNAPVTAFFCSTVPAFGFGPLSDDSEILQVENLECKPCGIHGHKDCPLGHFKCGYNIKTH
ncbi:MAG: glycosyltransferase family 9 protein [Fluviicola sp.]|nr:glycosyltransferase family 9 protein [Fluviicola sp.]